jgi:hypothetical protein
VGSYYDLMISKTPSIYVPFNNGTDADVMGTITLWSNVTSQLNPSFDYQVKKHGIRSKKIGHLGNSTYDTREYAISSNGPCYYYHAEMWVYLTTTTSTDFTALAQTWARPTSSYSNNSTFRINSNRTLSWFTQTYTGAGDHTLTGTTVLPINQWIHVACQYESTGLKKIFINGVLEASATGISTGGVAGIFQFCNQSSIGTIYFDEAAFWVTGTNTKPANFPTQAEILERATFPETKTKWWDATTSQWLKSGDEQYWNGTQWVSMQDKTYKYWNGSAWVTL